ncbi:MAG TPA: LamG-like jellyroll fold domain-containing protein [Opitutaceae bacterium]|nr:LamG-like jellyroll fold domain-containing protein [Opitutaceae bacterium]
MKSPSSRVASWIAVAVALVAPACLSAAEIWRVDNLQKFGTRAVVVEGAPRVQDFPGGKAVVFDGVRDGLFVTGIPIAGAEQYTIEVLFMPAEGGLAEQRFVHLQDTNMSRALLETRLNGKGGWWLDTFINTPPDERGLTLIDPTRVHPTGKWHWAALRYDGKIMSHFVNGQKEREGEFHYRPFADGTVSLGVRQNKVFWFKGAIREVRFHREALPEAKLQKVQ